MGLEDELSEAIARVEIELRKDEAYFPVDEIADICWLLARMNELQRYLATSGQPVPQPRFADRFGKHGPSKSS